MVSGTVKSFLQRLCLLLWIIAPAAMAKQVTPFTPQPSVIDLLPFIPFPSGTIGSSPNNEDGATFRSSLSMIQSNEFALSNSVLGVSAYTFSAGLDTSLGTNWNTVLNAYGFPSALPLNPTNTAFISPTGSDANLGTLASPWLTLSNACALTTNNWMIYCLPGFYDYRNISRPLGQWLKPSRQVFIYAQQGTVFMQFTNNIGAATALWWPADNDIVQGIIFQYDGPFVQATGNSLIGCTTSDSTTVVSHTNSWFVGCTFIGGQNLYHAELTSQTALNFQDIFVSCTLIGGYQTVFGNAGSNIHPVFFNCFLGETNYLNLNPVGFVNEATNLCVLRVGGAIQDLVPWTFINCTFWGCDYTPISTGFSGPNFSIIRDVTTHQGTNLIQLIHPTFLNSASYIQSNSVDIQSSGSNKVVFTGFKAQRGWLTWSNSALANQLFPFPQNTPAVVATNASPALTGTLYPIPFQ